MRAKMMAAFTIGFVAVVAVALAAMSLATGRPASVTAQEPAAAQADSPLTLAAALELDLCLAFRTAPPADGGELPADPAPAEAQLHNTLVFDLGGLERGDITTVMRFEDKDTVLAKVANVPLMEVSALDGTAGADDRAPLYGWLAVYYDAEGSPLCRSTGYAGLADEATGVTAVSLQGFVAQMAAKTRLSPANYQADARCSFDTPQYCEAIFRGDDSDEVIEGTEGSDLISAGAGSDTVNANEGDDVVDGGDGDDMISGGGGNDVIHGGDGDDIIRGGDGDDVIRGGDGDDNIHGDAGLDTLSGDNGVDTVVQ